MDIRQLLSRAYGGVDRFLPFDQMLDPIFAAPRMGQPQSRVPTMQGGQPQMPGSDVSIGQGGIMGPGEDFGQQLEMQPPQQPQQSFAPPMRGEAPKRSPVSFARTAWDTIIEGQSPWDSMDAQRARRQIAQQQAQIRANLPPDQQAVFDVSPELWAQYFGKPKEALPLDIVGDSTGGYRAIDRMTGETRRQEAGTPPPPKPGGKWEKGPDAWYWVPDDGLTPPRKGPAIGAAPKVFAPLRKPSGARGAPASPARSYGSGPEPQW